MPPSPNRLPGHTIDQKTNSMHVSISIYAPQSSSPPLLGLNCAVVVPNSSSGIQFIVQYCPLLSTASSKGGGRGAPARAGGESNRQESPLFSSLRRFLGFFFAPAAESLHFKERQLRSFASSSGKKCVCSFRNTNIREKKNGSGLL